MKHSVRCRGTADKAKGQVAENEPAEGPCDLSRREAGYYVPGTCLSTGYTLVKVLGSKDYELREKFEYVGRDGTSYVVPRGDCLNTDLASIPPFATWLVPKDGRHTQAALLHDAMIVKPGEAKDYEGPQDVTDEQADRIFRDGMRVGGVPFFRRWIIWTAVAMRSYWLRPGVWSKLRLFLSTVVFAVFSLYALPDVLNLPQIFRFRVVLCMLAALPSIVAVFLVGRRLRGKWYVKAIGFSAVVLLAAGFALILVEHVVPDNVTTWVPSFLPDIDDGRSFRWQGWRWDRPSNDDAGYFQLASFLALLLIGAAACAVLLLRRPRFGFLLAVLLGLLVFPLSFIAVSAAYYWVAEGLGFAVKFAIENVKKAFKKVTNWLLRS